MTHTVNQTLRVSWQAGKKREPVRRPVPRALAFLAPPPVMLFDDLLAAALRAARGIREVLGPDVHDRAARGEVLGLVAVHPKLRFADVVEEAHLVAVEPARASAGEGASGLSLELLRRRGIIPSTKTVSFEHVGVDFHD